MSRIPFIPAHSDNNEVVIFHTSEYYKHDDENEKIPNPEVPGEYLMYKQVKSLRIHLTDHRGQINDFHFTPQFIQSIYQKIQEINGETFYDAEQPPSLY
jgi:hypothetical protein